MFKMLVALLFSTTVFAQDLAQSPPSFSYKKGEAVFVDFITADYQIIFDVAQKTAEVTATIKFESAKVGYPVLDFVTDATSVVLNGVWAGNENVKTPDGATTVRVLSQLAKRGENTLIVKHPLSTLNWKDGGVHTAFWTGDLDDRQFLELYVPANLEFDRVTMTFEITVLNSSSKHKIYANGEVKEIANNKLIVKYPAHFNSSAVYFHLTIAGRFLEEQFDFRSINGKRIPVMMYARPETSKSELSSIGSKTTKTLNELEADYGPFPHPSVTVFYTGSRGSGMEYHGATVTSEFALEHELAHSYFARGIMPANGNAGWIDEAIASWRDSGYPRGSAFSTYANMAGMAPFTRFTSGAAYAEGSKFMADLDFHLASSGGLKPVLRKMIENHLFTPFFTEDFIQWTEGFTKSRLSEIFKRSVYQDPPKAKGNSLMSLPANPYHRKMSMEELRKLM